MQAWSGRFLERSGRLRSACRACGAVPWNAVAGCGDWRRACRVCGVCGAVLCGLLVGVSRGCRCAMGIAGQRVLSVARVLGIADQGVVWVAPCHWDC